MLPETRGHRLAPNLLKKFSQGPLTAEERTIFMTAVEEDSEGSFFGVFFTVAFPVGLDNIMSIYDISKDSDKKWSNIVSST